jgi:hypothetical protein
VFVEVADGVALFSCDGVVFCLYSPVIHLLAIVRLVAG